MEYVHLGRSGLSVSRLCLGTMNFGPLTPPDEAHAIMDHAHEIGINFFDTANRYGGASGWHVHVDSSDDAPWGEWFLTSSCLALAVLLAERQSLPAGICASPSCGRPFVNVGRGAARRYCSATCGTRERVAAHRAAGRAVRR